MNHEQLTLVYQLHIYILLYISAGVNTLNFIVSFRSTSFSYTCAGQEFFFRGVRRGPKGYSVLPGDGGVLGTYSEINYYVNKKFDFSRKCPEPSPRLPSSSPGFPLDTRMHACMQLNRSSTSIICAIHYVLMYNTTAPEYTKMYALDSDWYTNIHEMIFFVQYATTANGPDKLSILKI